MLESGFNVHKKTETKVILKRFVHIYTYTILEYRTGSFMINQCFWTFAPKYHKLWGQYNFKARAKCFRIFS